MNPVALGEGRYVLAEELGGVHFAPLHAAWDRELAVWRAARVCPAMASPSASARFVAERDALALIEHRHVLRLYDAGADAGSEWLITELVEGGTVAAWLGRTGPVGAAVAADLALEITSGLAAAHARRVAHGGIRLEDVLVTRDGVCRLSGFGARQHRPAAPADPPDAGRSVAGDVYGVAAMAVLLLTGKPPAFTEGGWAAPESLPESLRSALGPALHHGASDRCSLEELTDALQAALPGLRSADDGEAVFGPGPLPERRPPEAAVAVAAEGADAQSRLAARRRRIKPGTLPSQPPDLLLVEGEKQAPPPAPVAPPLVVAELPVEASVGERVGMAGAAPEPAGGRSGAGWGGGALALACLLLVAGAAWWFAGGAGSEVPSSGQAAAVPPPPADDAPAVDTGQGEIDAVEIGPR